MNAPAASIASDFHSTGSRRNANWTRALGEGELTFLADGVFDWRPVVRHLSRHGRSVCLSVEHVDHGVRHDPWETARRDGPFLLTLKQGED